MKRVSKSHNRLRELFKSLPCIHKFVVQLCLYNAVLFCLPCLLHAQAQKNTDTVDLAKIKLSASLNDYAFYLDTGMLIHEDRIAHLSFTRKIFPELPESAPLKVAGKNIYLKFAAHNSSDSIVQAYFFPGFFFTDIKVFKSLKKSLLQVEKAGFDDNISSSLALLTLQPKENAIFYIMISPLKSRVSTLSPHIITKGFANYFKGNISDEPINLVTYIICGFLLMMIFYSFALYFQDLKTEFLYYSAYAFCTGLLIFLKSYLDNYSFLVNYYFEGYFDFILQSTGFLFYIAFIRTFLQTAVEVPLLEKTFRISRWVIFSLLLLFSFAYFFSNSFIIPYIIENITKLFLVALSILFIIYGASRKDKVINYLVAGQSMLILFSIVSFTLIITATHILKKENSIFNDPMLYYEMGVSLELAFFFTALACKNKKDIAERAKESGRLKADNERKELEKQIAVMEAKNHERNRISADMHDELGSGVTAIRLMSEIVKTKMKGQPLPEIEKISSSANELLNKMNTIIWTMISSNDSAESLITYIRAYAVEYFESTLIECRVNIPSSIPEVEISGEKRRNIFLSVKEALNNVMKHAQASTVNISISIDKNLVITICDDGQGIDKGKSRRLGNGMNNMKKRMESIDGELNVQTNNGTKLVFKMNLHR